MINDWSEGVHMDPDNFGKIKGISESTKMTREDEIRERAETAKKEMLRIHTEMLDICTGNFFDQDPTWYRTWISEWFNTIKEFWTFEDIPYLLGEIDKLRAELSDPLTVRLPCIREYSNGKYGTVYEVLWWDSGFGFMTKPCKTREEAEKEAGK